MNLKSKKQLSKTINGNLLKQFYRLNRNYALKVNDLKLIYIPIPKVANRSIKEVLAQKLGMSGKLSAHKYKWHKISLNKVLLHSSFSFAFVRNPLDRLISCYVHKIEMNDIKKNLWKYGDLVSQDMSFEDFANFVCQTPDSIADRHFKSQYQFLYQKEQLIVDYIGKFETIQKDWDQLAIKFNLGQLNHANKSLRVEIDKYYTKELAEKVAKHYKKDIELFGYKSEIELLISKLS